jgi:hypothetical protein
MDVYYLPPEELNQEDLVALRESEEQDGFSGSYFKNSATASRSSSNGYYKIGDMMSSEL